VDVDDEGCRCFAGSRAEVVVDVSTKRSAAAPPVAELRWSLTAGEFDDCR